MERTLGNVIKRLRHTHAAHVPTPPSAETEADSSPPTSYSHTDEAYRTMDHGCPQAAEETLVTELSPSPTNMENHVRIDKEPTRMDQGTWESLVFASPPRTSAERLPRKLQTQLFKRFMQTRTTHVPALPSAETEAHSSPATSYSQTDEEHRTMDHGHSPAAEETRVMEFSPSPTIMENHVRTDKEPTKLDQVTWEHLAFDFPPRTSVERLPRKLRTPQATEKAPVIVNVEDLRTDDVVIAVMGPTGSGKSTFIRSASGYDTQVCHTLKSFTSEVLGIRFWDQESRRYVVLVDTPGFDDTYTSHLDTLKMISDWLNSRHEKHKPLSGILYLHRITDNRMAATPLKNLREFRKLCGRDALAKVYLTTTMWDEVEPKVGERRLDELKTDYWQTMIAYGAEIARCRSDDDSPKELIRRILTRESPRIVQPQEGIAEPQTGLEETNQTGPNLDHAPTPPSTEAEAHSLPLTDYSQTDQVHRTTDHGRFQVPEETRVTEFSPPPTITPKVSGDLPARTSEDFV